ncbi:hypothetical protein V5N11_004936 [Cardamine amara subsp. amara]|uniref:Uncharacterized protein n=1 Tax=Cardamine amara subsp. amara TaxID=228776 RepID=A0ABD0ZX11_CARAN
MEEVFPKLSQLSAHLQKMVYCLEQVIPDCLPQFRDYEQIFQVLDTDEKLRCLFKALCDDNEQLARKCVNNT